MLLVVDMPSGDIVTSASKPDREFDELSEALKICSGSLWAAAEAKQTAMRKRLKLAGVQGPNSVTIVRM